MDVTFKEIDEIQAKKIAITNKIKSATKSVIDLVERGMTKSEVKSLVDVPRSTGCGDDDWNYGNVWVVFESGVVSCIVGSINYQPCYKRESYKIFNPFFNVIIK